MKENLLITCEHAGNIIPPEYKHLFKNGGSELDGHRSMDIGTLEVAKHISTYYKVPLIFTEISRLVIDTNRSLWRRTLFSEFMKGLSKSEKEEVLNKYYHPHQEKVKSAISEIIDKHGSCVHIAVHSFTPNMNGKTRKTDIGLLYDPERPSEKSFSKTWKSNILKFDPDLNIRFNYPYRGKPDGVTARMRKIYPDEKYIGIELEMNQKFVLNNPDQFKKLKKVIIESVK